MFLTGWGGAASGTAVPIEILQMSNDGITMQVRGALKHPGSPGRLTGQDERIMSNGRGNPDRKPRGLKSEVQG